MDAKTNRETLDIPREIHTAFYVQVHNNRVYLTKEIVEADVYLGMVRTDACGDVVRLNYE